MAEKRRRATETAENSEETNSAPSVALVATPRPQVGRVVWYYPRVGHGPLAALITKVCSNTLVNLCVFTEDGEPHGSTSIPFVSDEIQPEWPHCKWPPFGRFCEPPTAPEVESSVPDVRG